MSRLDGARAGWAALFLSAAALLPGTGARAQAHEFLPWKAGQRVPALEARDLEGRPWRLTELRGKAVLINFWASWCEPCLAEMPSLQQLAQRHGPQKVLVLALNFKESEAQVRRFAERSGLQLPLLLDPRGEIARRWGVRVFPSTVLLGADGRLHGVVRGELDWSGAVADPLLAPLLASALDATGLRR